MRGSSTRPRANWAFRPDKVVVTVDQHANTSAASVPLALDTAVRDGRIKRGDLVVLEAMGGGFTWGAAALTLLKIRQFSRNVELPTRHFRLLNKLAHASVDTGREDYYG